MKNFETLGVMLDCSRNAVLTVPETKKYITLIAKMGYNQLQLYMEDTYEVKGEEHLGYLRGRYSAKELKELDDFAYNSGVELVPNIQTLAHLKTSFLWNKYNDMKDIDDILRVGDEGVYNFIENMFSSLRDCFRTDKIHIGMDEAWNLGRGKYYDAHGDSVRSDVLVYHIKRVCALADKYNFKPMMWGDMFERLAANSTPEYKAKIKAQMPENLSLVYWEYGGTKKRRHMERISFYEQFSNKIIFAGGATKWLGFAPHNAYSVKVIKAQFAALREKGIKNAFITCWGDNGAEASVYSNLPAICYAACLAQGIEDMASVKAKFKEWVGYEYDDFMLLDLPNNLFKANRTPNPCKYFLYNDCFMGILDPVVKPEYCKKYATYARRLKNASKRVGEYAVIFETLSKLCSVLAIKTDLGLRTKEAYLSKDTDSLNAVIADYKKVIKRVKELYNSLRIQWFAENKPNGFDVQDIRFGGLIMRLQSCMERLIAYRNGEVESISELDEEHYNDPDQIKFFLEMYNTWAEMVTPNVL